MNAFKLKFLLESPGSSKDGTRSLSYDYTTLTAVVLMMLYA